MLELVGELGGGFEELVALDEAALDAELHVVLDNALYGFHNQACSKCHKLVMEGPCCVCGLYTALGPQNDTSGVDVLVYHERGDAGDVLTVDNGPVDGGGATVLRQQGGVEVERAKLRHGPDGLRQHAEAHHYKQIGLPGGKVRKELRVLELFRLKQRQTMLQGVFLHCRFVHLEASARRFVRSGYHAHNLVPGFDETVHRPHGELRRTHIYDSRFPEHAYDFTLYFPEPDLDAVHVEDALVLDGFDGEEGAYRRQYKGRYEFAGEGVQRSVSGKALARDVHHPVKDEEQQRNNCRRAQAALLQYSPHRCADEEQQQAGQRRGVLLPDFDICTAYEGRVMIGFHGLPADKVFVLAHGVGGAFIAALLFCECIPFFVRRYRHGGYGRCFFGGVQLGAVGEG